MYKKVKLALVWSALGGEGSGCFGEVVICKRP